MSERILVVDDEKLVRWSLKEGLSKKGYSVSVAESGEEGLNLIVDEPVSLVLLDNRLLKFLKRLRKLILKYLLS